MPATGGVSIGGAMAPPSTADKVPGGDVRSSVGILGNDSGMMMPPTQVTPPGGGDGAGWMKPTMPPPTPTDLSPPTPSMTGGELPPLSLDPTGSTTVFGGPSGGIYGGPAEAGMGNLNPANQTQYSGNGGPGVDLGGAGGVQTQYGPQAPLVGRGGAQQSMGNGRFGGAPPEQVIAQRRAALQRRMQALQPWNG
jgi:hypothetical protein